MASHPHILDFEREDIDVPKSTICVIGSGPAGAVVAAELALAGIDVLLLEAGGMASAPLGGEGGPVGNLTATGGTDMRFGFARQLGGSSNLWAGRTAPLDPVDFEARSWIPDSGWPITRREMAPYYARAAALLAIPDAVAAQGPLSGLPGMEAKNFQWADKPFNAHEYLAALLNKTKNLRICLNAPVVELIEDQEGGKIGAAIVQIPGGRKIRIAADTFILAAGGIETPRLLLNSTGRHPGGVGNRYDAVGRYFSTHPKADMAVMVLDKAVSLRSPLFSDQAVAGGKVRQGLAVSRSVQEQLGLPNHYVQLSALLEYKVSRMFEAVKGSGVLSSPFIDRNALLRGYLPGLGLMAYEATGRIAGWQRKARMFTLRAFLDQFPDPDNRITRSLSRDRGGNPQADITWRFSARDRASVMAFFKHLDSALRETKQGRLEYGGLNAVANEDWPLIGIHSHFMGTTRMGTTPHKAVTDPSGRVFGVDNLYIAGPSLFPSYGYANPFYTIVALSLRLADHIKTERGILP